MLIFEQPLNELTRLNLRIEYLFQMIDSYQSENNPGKVIRHIVKITHLLDRPDLKSKYAKSIQDHLDFLKQLSENSGIDNNKLTTIINDLEELFDYYNQSRNKLGQPLRDCEFLNNIRQHMLYPGGDASFELNALQSWLQCPNSVVDKQIDAWLDDLKIIRLTVSLLLKLTRNKGREKEVIANQGFHQELLDSNSHCQLVRIELEQNTSAYPIISAGKHRLMIRFYEATHLDSEEQAQRDISFKLVCCS